MLKRDGRVDRCSFSPARIPNLKLAAEQLSTGERWIPPEKDTPPSRKKEKPHQDGRRGETEFRIKSQTHQRRLEGSNKTLWAPGPRDPIETETELYLSDSTGQQWPATGARSLGAADLGHTAYGISPLGGGRH